MLNCQLCFPLGLSSADQSSAVLDPEPNFPDRFARWFGCILDDLGRVSIVVDAADLYAGVIDIEVEGVADAVRVGAGFASGFSASFLRAPANHHCLCKLGLNEKVRNDMFNFVHSAIRSDGVKIANDFLNDRNVVAPTPTNVLIVRRSLCSTQIRK